MSDAMPDPRPGTSRPADFAQDADAQCRGIGLSGTPERSSRRGRGGGASPTTPADVPVARPVVRDADECVERSAITQAATQARARGAAERAALERPPVATGAAAPAPPPSAELVALLDRLRAAVGRYVGGRRRAGAPVERVLPEVKALAREAVGYAGWHDPAEALMRQVVGWTIAAFYDAPAPRQASPAWPEGPEGQEGPDAPGRG
jgi:hypothetical protein